MFSQKLDTSRRKIDRVAYQGPVAAMGGCSPGSLGVAIGSVQGAGQGQLGVAAHAPKGQSFKAPVNALVHVFDAGGALVLATKDLQNSPSTRNTSRQGSTLVWKPMARHT